MVILQRFVYCHVHGAVKLGDNQFAKNKKKAVDAIRYEFISSFKLLLLTIFSGRILILKFLSYLVFNCILKGVDGID